ncbi:FecR family protein [Pustulibacterium marinum]|uniref:FecR family protein n=1 Tax=Pustulibacterium marinum TaxID=1224947 RepID=A0A1I7IN55_9FLAO|nr:FecR domain-containing protein [Pustulibacterium marinum]SFU74352.1 FecR family protein [Pustulibacterium marinum]
MKDENYLAKLLTDELTATEKNKIPPEDLQIFEAIKKHSAELETPLNKDVSKMLATVLHSPKKKKRYRMSIFQYASIAAAVLICISLGIFLNNPKTTYYAQRGTAKKVALPDGSEVQLNADSQISYNTKNWSKERTIQLEGEAYFKVKKGSSFRVETQKGTVTVLGTQFNVKDRATSLLVTCYEGRVQVSNNNTSVILTPGNSITLTKNEWIENKTFVNQPEWTQQQIRFEKTQLHEVIAELERKYNITIQTNGSVNNSKYYTGTIPANDLTIALSVIEQSFKVRFEQQNQNSYTLKEH